MTLLAGRADPPQAGIQGGRQRIPPCAEAGGPLGRRILQTPLAGRQFGFVTEQGLVKLFPAIAAVLGDKIPQRLFGHALQPQAPQHVRNSVQGGASLARRTLLHRGMVGPGQGDAGYRGAGQIHKQPSNQSSRTNSNAPITHVTQSPIRLFHSNSRNLAHSGES